MPSAGVLRALPASAATRLFQIRATLVALVDAVEQRSGRQPQHQRNAQRHEDHVVEKADHRNEVGDQVDRAAAHPQTQKTARNPTPHSRGCRASVRERITQLPAGARSLW